MERYNTLLTDLYQLTMINGYHKCGTANKTAVFDVFFRKGEEKNYAVVAGLDQAIDYILNLKFTAEDLDYLRSLKLFEEDFLQKLATFKFTGDIYAMPEGTIAFPGEPLVTVVAPIFEAQFIEPCLLTIINHQTLIATKASRMVNCTKGAIAEFGLRRAQGADAGLYGARAAMIGGCSSTSNVLCGKMFDVPVSGTHSHSWVMSFPDELTAFRQYAELYPNNCLLLVDTYDTINSGIPNAITVFKEMKAKGLKPLGIRLDSGDLAYLSINARKMLDEAGLPEVKIFASNDIDENILLSLKAQDAKIDVWGIGTKLITSYSNPTLGGVYKMAAIEQDGTLIPKMKISNTYEKITNPGFKKVVRIFNKETGMAEADLIMLRDEVIDESQPLTIFHPIDTWKKMTFDNYYVKELQTQIFKDGKLIYERPTVKQIMAFEKDNMAKLPEEYKRIYNPHIYKVDLSQKLYDLKETMLINSTKKQ